MRILFFVGLLVVAAILGGCTTSNTLVEQAQQAGAPVIVVQAYAGAPNSAGGVDANVGFYSASNRSLKYVVFVVTPYNRVGDVAPSEIGRKSTTRLRAVGPYEYGRGNINFLGSSYWNNVWYNHSIRCMQIDAIEITYMDESTETVGADRIHAAIGPNVRRSCK